MSRPQPSWPLVALAAAAAAANTAADVLARIRGPLEEPTHIDAEFQRAVDEAVARLTQAAGGAS